MQPISLFMSKKWRIGELCCLTVIKPDYVSINHKLFHRRVQVKKLIQEIQASKQYFT